MKWINSILNGLDVKFSIKNMEKYIVYLFWPIISFVMSYPRASIDILLLFICLIVIVRIIRR